MHIAWKHSRLPKNELLKIFTKVTLKVMSASRTVFDVGIMSTMDRIVSGNLLRIYESKNNDSYE